MLRADSARSWRALRPFVPLRTSEYQAYPTGLRSPAYLSIGGSIMAYKLTRLFTTDPTPSVPQDQPYYLAQNNTKTTACLQISHRFPDPPTISFTIADISFSPQQRFLLPSVVQPCYSPFPTHPFLSFSVAPLVGRPVCFVEGCRCTANVYNHSTSFAPTQHVCEAR